MRGSDGTSRELAELEWRDYRTGFDPVAASVKLTETERASLARLQTARQAAELEKMRQQTAAACAAIEKLKSEDL